MLCILSFDYVRDVERYKEMSSRGRKSLSLLQDQDSMIPKDQNMFDFILNKKVNKAYCRKEKENLRKGVDVRSSRLLEIEMGLALARSRAALTGPSSSLSPVTAQI